MKFFYILFILITMPPASQTGHIKGLATTTGHPLEGVMIGIEDHAHITYTTKDGRFSFENMPEGLYRIYASLPGFKIQKQELTLRHDIPIIINFDLMADVNDLEEILIIDKNAGLNRKTPYNISTIEMQGLQTAGSPGGLMGHLREMPGVYGAELGQGIIKPFIRGLGFTRVVTIYQGNKLENHQWGADHGLGVNDLGIKNVDIIKGPASVLYGSGALGGVILINDNEDFLKNHSITGNAGSTWNSISKGYRFNAAVGKKFRNKMFFSTAIAYENHADYKDGNNRTIGNSRFNVTTMRMHTGYDGEKFRNKISISYNLQNLGIMSDEEMQPGMSLATYKGDRVMQLPFQKVEDILLSYDQKFFHNTFETILHVSHHRNTRKEIETSFAETDLGLTQNHTFYNARITYPNHRLSHSLGIQGSYLTNRNLPEAREILIPDADLVETGFYYLTGIDLDSWFIQGAARFDYREITAMARSSNFIDQGFILPGNPENKQLTRIFSGYTASIGITKNMSLLHTVKLNFSGGFRAPDLAELFSNGPHPGTSRFEKGNDGFEREQSLQAELTYAFHNKRFRLNFAGYGSRISNYIFFEASGIPHENGMELWEYRQTPVTLNGLEFEIKHYWIRDNRLETRFNGSMVRALDRETGGHLAFIPPDNINATVDYYALDNKSLHLNSRFRIVNHQYRTGPSEQVTPGYALLDFGISKRWYRDQGMIEVGIRLQNALNKTYTDHMSILRAFNIPSPCRNLRVNLKYNF